MIAIEFGCRYQLSEFDWCYGWTDLMGRPHRNCEPEDGKI